MENLVPRPASHTNTEISFKPLSEGLGFHPFSDGLPYAPITKTPKPKVPQAAPLMQSALVSSQSESSLKVQVPIVKQEQKSQRQTLPKPSPAPTAVSPEVEAQTIGYRPPRGYLFRRTFAFLIDSFIGFILFGIILGGLLWQQEAGNDFLFNTNAIYVAFVLMAMLNWMFISFQEIFFKTTLGKKTFGLKFDGTPGAILLRSVFFIFSFSLGGIGLLWSLGDRRRRCLHDIFVDLQPVDRGRL